MTDMFEETNISYDMKDSSVLTKTLSKNYHSWWGYQLTKIVQNGDPQAYLKSCILNIG